MSNLEIARNGVVSGTVRAFVISPIEVVKIQQQVNPARSLVQVASEVWRTAGLRGFARGFTTTLTREPVAFGCYFSSFEILSRGRKESNSWLFVAGGLAGICSWVTTYPQVPTVSLRPTLIPTPGGRDQVPSAGRRLGSSPEILRHAPLPQTDHRRGGLVSSLQGLWINYIQSFHCQRSHPDGLQQHHDTLLMTSSSSI